jgi:serine O-acetyltransferase
VIIYSGATILGGQTIIGEHSIIGGNVWLTKSVPPYSSVYHRATIEVVDRKLID